MIIKIEKKIVLRICNIGHSNKYIAVNANIILLNIKNTIYVDVIFEEVFIVSIKVENLSSNQLSESCPWFLSIKIKTKMGKAIDIAKNKIANDKDND